jgi:hypothetical protein
VVIGHDAAADRLVITIPVFGRETAVPLAPTEVERIP